VNLDYERYMQSAEWAAKRAQRLAVDGHKCRTCGHTGETWPLQVHHVTYERFEREDIEQDLITLCANCHEAITDAIRRRRYDGRQVEAQIIETTITMRQEFTYGVASSEVQSEIIVCDARPQRATRMPR